MPEPADSIARARNALADHLGRPLSDDEVEAVGHGWYFGFAAGRKNERDRRDRSADPSGADCRVCGLRNGDSTPHLCT